MMRSLDKYSVAELDAMSAMEASLREQYPTRGIVTESILAPDCEDNPFPGKYTVEITCCDCGATRRIATQDLFQVSRCVACTEKNRKANRAANRAAKRAAKKATPAETVESIEAQLAALQARKAALEASEEETEVHDALTDSVPSPDEGF